MKSKIFRVVLPLALLIPGLAGAFNATLWLQEFYQDQDVNAFPEAISAWKSREALEDIDSRQPIVGFLSYAFAKYPEMIEVAIGDGMSLTEGEKEAFALALHRAGTDSATAALRKIGFADLLEAPTPPVLSEIVIADASELDLCWGYFYGSGDVAVLKPIVAVLENHTFAPAMDAYREARELENDEEAAKYREEAFRYAMFEAAQWSLRFNAKRHPRVHQYLEIAVNSSDTSEIQREQLQLILASDEEVSDEL